MVQRADARHLRLSGARRRLAFAAVAAALAVTGCGGGGPAGPDPTGVADAPAARDAASVGADAPASGRVGPRERAAPAEVVAAHGVQTGPGADGDGVEPTAAAGRVWRVVCGRGGLGLQATVDAARDGDAVRVVGDCGESAVIEGKALSVVHEADPVATTAAAPR